MNNENQENTSETAYWDDSLYETTTLEQEDGGFSVSHIVTLILVGALLVLIVVFTVIFCVKKKNRKNKKNKKRRGKKSSKSTKKASGKKMSKSLSKSTTSKKTNTGSKTSTSTASVSQKSKKEAPPKKPLALKKPIAVAPPVVVNVKPVNQIIQPSVPTSSSFSVPTTRASISPAVAVVVPESIPEEPEIKETKEVVESKTESPCATKEPTEKVTVLCCYGNGWKAKSKPPKDFSFSIESE